MEARVINEGRNYNPHRRFDILKWMQEEQNKNPRAFKDTTAAAICNRYVMAHPECASQTIQGIFVKLIRNNFIIKHKTGGFRATFRINYLHPNLPRDFVEKAPDDDKKFIQSVADRVAEKKENGENVSVTTDGTIVTKPEPTEEPKPEVVQTSVPVSIEKDGKSFSITVNLNINLKG